MNSSTYGVKTDDSGVASYTVSRPTAGTYTFGASFVGDENNNSKTATDIANYTVNKATPAAADFSFTPASAIYDGSPHSITASSSLTGAGAITIYYNGSTTAPTDAGNHTYTAEYAGDGDHYATANATSSAIFIIYTAIDAANAPSVIVYSQHDDLIVKSESTIQRIMVYNISGQLIKEVKPGSNYIEISRLPKTQVLIVNVVVDGKTGSYKVEIEK